MNALLVYSGNLWLNQGFVISSSSFQRRLESKKRGRGGEWLTGFVGWRVGWSSLSWSFPLCGNVLSKPLDSGLRRNDAMAGNDGGGG